MEYTKDDWEAVKSPAGDWVIQGKNTGILICREARHYNAHLIAAAPDLYEALRLVLNDLWANLDNLPDIPAVCEFWAGGSEAIIRAGGKSKPPF